MEKEFEKYLEIGKKTMMGFKKDIAVMEKLRKTEPKLYEEVMLEVRNTFRKAEIDYVNNMEKLDRKAFEYYKSQPFGDNPLGHRFPINTAKELYIFGGFVEKLDLPQGSKILDLGCGSGWIAIFLAKMGYEVTGVEIAPSKLDIAKEKAKNYQVNVNFLIKDAEQLYFKEEFDAIIISATLHHCLNEKKVLQQCYAALKPKGKIMMVEPGPKQPILSQKVVEKYGTIEKGFKRKYLKELLEEIGFKRIIFFVQLANLERKSMLLILKQFVKTLVHYFGMGPNIILAEK